jgi:hypothetical protein
MRLFEVVQPVFLGYGSHVRHTTPTRHKLMQPGTLLRLQSEAPNGNVWFLDPDGERGKIECGEVRNLTRDGRVVERTQ